MIDRIIGLSLPNRLGVTLGAVVLVILGCAALVRLPIDAMPDATTVQVQVLTKAPALGPVEVEQFITRPVENAMSGLPNLDQIRSVSRYGISAVTVVFREGTDIYFARNLVAQRLSAAQEAIPPGVERPEMGPITTGLGEIFHFVLEGDGFFHLLRRNRRAFSGLLELVSLTADISRFRSASAISVAASAARASASIAPVATTAAVIEPEARADTVPTVVPDKPRLVVGFSTLDQSIPAAPVAVTSSVLPDVVGRRAERFARLNSATTYPTTDTELTVPVVITA